MPGSLRDILTRAWLCSVHGDGRGRCSTSGRSQQPRGSSTRIWASGRATSRCPTVGVPNAIGMLASHLKEHSLQLTLAVSIHAPSQAVRQRIIPRLAFGSTFLHFTSAMTQMLRGGGHRNELHVLHDLEPQPWQIAFE